MSGALRRVLVRKPEQSFAAAEPASWNYLRKPNLEVALEEHARFVELVGSLGAEVSFHDRPLPQLADALYTHDPVLVTTGGSIPLRMGKLLRRGEEEAIEACLAKLGVPALGRIVAPGIAEGGDLLWLDDSTLAIGIGFRTNMEGARQLTQLLAPLGVSTLTYQLPYLTGPEACLHLMSLLSLVDKDLAVVFPKLMPVSLWQELKARSFQLVEVPEAEFDRQATNVLALAPRQCVMISGCPETERRLRAAGCEVRTYAGTEISDNGGGGPTCLTRPILRDRIG